MISRKTMANDRTPIDRHPVLARVCILREHQLVARRSSAGRNATYAALNPATSAVPKPVSR